MMMSPHPPSWLRQLGRALALAALCLGLAACQSLGKPPQPPAQPPAEKLTPEQVAGLKVMEFMQETQGWALSFSESKFLFNSAEDVLSESGRQMISDVAKGLNQAGIDRIRVEGHTDSVGPPDANRALSLRRADFVARQLVLNGFPEKGIERKGFGASKPVADNSTPEGRAQNRRVTLIVVSD